MLDNNGHHHGPHHGPHGKHGRGPSSFWMHDPETISSNLKLKGGDCFLDLGCGPGDYSIQASKIVGDSGLVFALDRGKEVLDKIKEKIISENCLNIKVLKSDITNPLPLNSGCVDVCLLATVLHIFRIKKAKFSLFGEIHRVLKPGGCLAVIECKKEDQPFGPPKHIRLAPEEVDEAVRDYGFNRVDLVDLGYNYLIKFMAE